MPKGRDLKMAPTRRVDFEPSENDFLVAVLELAKLCHWRVAHFRAAKTDT